MKFANNQMNYPMNWVIKKEQLRKCLFHFCPFLLALSISFSAFGSVEPKVSNSITGNSIRANGSFQVKDTKLGTPAAANVVATNRVKNTVSLTVNQQLLQATANVPATNLKYVVDFQLLGKRWDGTVVDERRRVEYAHYNSNPESVASINAMVAAEGFHQMDIKVYFAYTISATGVSDYGAVFPNYITLSADMEIDRVMKFDCNQFVSNLTHGTANPTNQKHNLTWLAMDAADEYDVEWTFYDPYSTVTNAVTKDQAWYESAFINNASRSTVKSSPFTLSLMYPNGLVLYRVRGANYGANGQRQVSAWSPVGTTAKHYFSTASINATIANNNWNWQSKTVFAEEGKYTQSVQFYDASLRERQTQVLSNAAGTVVASETIYDYQGRPALKVMPAPKPVATPFLEYDDSLAKNNAKLPYSANDFVRNGDQPSDCNPGTLMPSMSTASTGAAQYYSPENPLKKTGENKYIPDALGYPFSVTEYTPDATGRVARQGGVGKEYQLNVGHETKYFYSKPNQSELDLLFGTDVGYSDHYLKNVVVDPNGQVSTAYVDAHGRTIATALSGGVPTNVDALGNSGERTLTVDLLNNRQSQNDLVSTYSLTVTDKEQWNLFQYRLLNLMGVEACKGVCYDCAYDLEIKITPEKCNLPPIILTYWNTNVVSRSCQLKSISRDTNLFLTQGIYHITKTLRVNQGKAEDYLRDYLTSPCVRTKLDFETEEISRIQLSDCKDGEPTDCEVCRTSTTLTPEQKTYCNKFCKADCSKLYMDLVEDLKPTGQYGFKNNHGVFVNAANQPIPLGGPYLALSNSVFTASNLATWRLTYPTLPETVTELVENWRDEWADWLMALSVHPESCYLFYCQQKVDLLTIYENTIMANPKAALQGVSSFPTATDPIRAGIPSLYINSFMSNINNIPLIQLAKSTAYCMSNSGCTDAFLNGISAGNSGDQIKDEMYWQALANLYISQRRSYFYKYLVNLRCYNLVPLENLGKVIRVKQVETEQANLASQGTATGATNAQNQSCSDVCDANAKTWIAQLGGCLPGFSSAHVDYKFMVADLKAICENSCKGNINYPRGATNLLPGSSPIRCSVTGLNPAVYFTNVEEVIAFYYKRLRSGATPPVTCRGYGLFPGTVEAQNVLPFATNNANLLDKRKIQDLHCCWLNNKDSLRVHHGYINELAFLNSFSTVQITQAQWDNIRTVLSINDTCRLLNSKSTAAVSVTDRYLSGTMLVPPQFLNSKCQSCSDLATKALDYVAISAPPATGTAAFESMEYAKALGNYLNYRTGLNQPYREYLKFLLSCNSLGTSALTAYVNGTQQTFSQTEQNAITSETTSPSCSKMLCPVIEHRIVITPEPCSTKLERLARLNAATRYSQYIEQVKLDFINNYVQTCLNNARKVETFTDTYKDKEKHYTLYYYDQGGNLVQTVPPAGVVPFATSDLASVQLARAEGIRKVPAHLDNLITKYWYNSLNQVFKQKTPDADVSLFWYDALGRLTLSQNAQQRLDSKFSYTRFDSLGRTVEVGVGFAPWGTSPCTTDDDCYQRAISVAENISGGIRNKTEITQTRYDEMATGYDYPADFQPTNLRNRVAVTTFSEDGSTESYSTHYTYDVAGNVKTLLHRIPELNALTARAYVFISPRIATWKDQPTHQYKRLDYEYDLVSGKVNRLWYQRNQLDQFGYQYLYDADNRLVEAQTTTDGTNWVRDAKYKYYKHGPLSRTELGNEALRVQGVDYAYTLQGWIKGVNAGLLDPNMDMGGDRTTTSSKADVFGYTIGYNQDDYSPIGGVLFEPRLQNAQDLKGLYNGNIRYTMNQIQGFGGIAYNYTYDQLNRISGMTSQTISGTSWSWNTSGSVYKENVTYDANGNIQTYFRKDATGADLDKLDYSYDPMRKNRLTAVKDGAPNTANFADDVEGTETFEYDANGNLKKQSKPSGVTQLTWNAYGKVSQVIQGTTTMTFGYDAQQHRLKKSVTRSGRTTTTYYIRDAQGNSLAVYERRQDTLIWKEQHLYGSSRLGMLKPEKIVTGAVNDVSNGSGYYASRTTIGAKSYELSNHLGNVMAVISDRGVLLSAQDYYPFGMTMPGRNTEAKYRYGFNGKETDPETGIQDYGMRWYLPNIARFPSVDPITKKYPELTPYQFASNRPIDGIDLDGLEFSKSTYTDQQGIIHVKITLKVRPGVTSTVLTIKQSNLIFKKTQEQFSNTVGTTCDEKRKIQYEGELTYDDNATIAYTLGDQPKGSIVSGLSTPGSAGVNGVKYNENGLPVVKNFDAVAVDGVHELLHQGGIDHPTDEDNMAQDVALEIIDPSKVQSDNKVVKNNSFKSKESTILPDIYLNIMIYGFKVVDGKRVSDVRGSDKNGVKVSPEQLNIIIDNIDKGKVNGEAMQKY
jgi:RHS repeat-associated protein